MQKLTVKKNLNNSSEVWDVFVDEKFIGAIEKIDDGTWKYYKNKDEEFYRTVTSINAVGALLEWCGYLGVEVWA